MTAVFTHKVGRQPASLPGDLNDVKEKVFISTVLSGSDH